MFDGKMKAVTFSFDDGVTQDKRLIEIFDSYGLKCTFNLNSELLGKEGELVRESNRVTHNKVFPDEVREVYRGHEVAVHTLTHPNLTEIAEDAEVIRQVECDRQKLSELVGYNVVGMAYPCGGVNNDDRVARLIADNTGVKYSRTITSNYSFEPQENLYRFNPTVYLHGDGFERANELAERFLSEDAETPKIFYIWSHSYEFDIHNTWDEVEKFCRLISGHDDVFYGTNTEVLLAR